MTRERICLNGLWRWQPAEATSADLPDDNWGYFKVPGCWPGITDYMQKDCQTVHAHPVWKSVKLGAATAACYQREITIPNEFRDRRIGVQVDCLNSFALSIWTTARLATCTFPVAR